jgi:methylthioribose-1-phosphate isomerase
MPQKFGRGSSRWHRPDTPVYNPAFDVTPHELITAFITEKGIVKPDFSKNLEKIRPPQD